MGYVVFFSLCFLITKSAAVSYLSYDIFTVLIISCISTFIYVSASFSSSLMGTGIEFTCISSDIDDYGVTCLVFSATNLKVLFADSTEFKFLVPISFIENWILIGYPLFALFLWLSYCMLD